MKHDVLSWVCKQFRCLTSCCLYMNFYQLPPYNISQEDPCRTASILIANSLKILYGVKCKAWPSWAECISNLQTRARKHNLNIPMKLCKVDREGSARIFLIKHYKPDSNMKSYVDYSHYGLGLEAVDGAEGVGSGGLEELGVGRPVQACKRPERVAHVLSREAHDRGLQRELCSLSRSELHV